MPLLIEAGNASAWTGPTGNNTYLLTGRVPTLIDAGVGRPEHIERVARALDGAALAAVLVTHGHVDHLAGAEPLAARWPALRVRQLETGADPIVAGERISAGDFTLVAVPTPGHSPDHCCFLIEETRDVFCGDLVRLGGTVVIPATRGGDLAQYLESLQRVRDLEPRRLLPGHGLVVDDPVRVIDEYVAHRRQRERQVLSLIAAGPRTLDDLVQNIYPGLSETLKAAARETVLAHVVKLERDHQVVRRGDWVSQAG